MKMILFCQKDPSHEGVLFEGRSGLQNSGAFLFDEGQCKFSCSICGAEVAETIPEGWIMQEERILDDNIDAEHYVQFLLFGPTELGNVRIMDLVRTELAAIVAEILEGDDRDALEEYLDDSGEPIVELLLEIDNSSELGFLWEILEPRLREKYGVVYVYDEWWHNPYDTDEVSAYLDPGKPLIER